jgi:hypothetical protein
MALRPKSVLGAVSRFAADLAEAVALPGGAQPEDQLKRPVQRLIEEVGAVVLKRRVKSRTEARVEGLGARPDLVVLLEDRLLVGHVELKAPGKGARVERLKGADKAQWERLQRLPNLIYTDGCEWALYREGRRVAGPVILLEDPERGAAGLGHEAAAAVEALLRDFALWEPAVPTSPRGLAALLAPVCRFLREEVEVALKVPNSALATLAAEWRRWLFPEASDEQFADAYAQTVTYTLLLARFEGAERITVETANQALDQRHSLLARAVLMMSLPELRAEIGLGIELVERVVGAVQEEALRRLGDDPWLYFYEDFLAEYDPRLRKARGVYYTPPEVVRVQVRLTAELLTEKLGKRLAFADDGVVVLDPAAGTGAYLREALAQAVDLVRNAYGPGDVPARMGKLAQNLHGFEILVGPYAVAHLRLTQGILDHGGELPSEGVHVFLADTLESPLADPAGEQLRFSLMERPLAEEHRRAREVKAKARVLVCFGNPPYDREQLPLAEQERRRKGGWVRHGDRDKAPGELPILDTFLAPARAAGQGVHLKNLYNDYVYFWRWALWKVFETGGGPGVVSFITASSYLRGPGFGGMRQVMREVLDELWLLDLEGDDRGPRKTENVFNIQTPVAIAVGVRYGAARPEVPARVHYAKVSGTRAEKLATLRDLEHFDQVDWRDGLEGWMEPFMPGGDGAYFSWPLLTDLFPWRHSGVQFKRTWPIGPTRGVVETRWRRLATSFLSERAALLRETEARTLQTRLHDLGERPRLLPPLSAIRADDQPGWTERFGFRSFDVQWALVDPRLADRIRPPLVASLSSQQVFLTSLFEFPLGAGPAATVAAVLPDLHHFCGRGGKDVVPLFRDGAGRLPNLVSGLSSRLGRHLGWEPSGEDFFAYVYGILASPAFVERFWDELSIPGPRLPVTRDPVRFARTVRLGRRLVFLHTFAQRFVPEGHRRGEVPRGRARSLKAIPSTPAGYPEEFSWDEDRRILRVGEGEIGPVEAAVWGFSVSGLEVVRSWLGHRMKKPTGRASSPLDEIRPERWTAEMTEELLHLLWVLEATIEVYPELERNLVDLLSGPLFAAGELPRPAAAEREPPAPDEGDPSLPIQAELGF